MLYRFTRFVFFLYFSIFNKVSVVGSENIPPSGGVMICANHISNFDPLLVGVYATKRKVHFMAKAELFKNKFFAIILKGINAFPVKRGKGDISAIKTSFKILNNGEVLGLFPEGKRSKSGKILPAEPGAAMIAIKTDVPVVPIRIKGSYKLFRRLDIFVGKPISFSQYTGKKLSMDEINELSQTIMKEIRNLG